MNNEATVNALQAEHLLTTLDKKQPQLIKTILLLQLQKQILLPKHFLLALVEALRASVRST